MLLAMLEFDVAQTRLAAAGRAPTSSERVALQQCQGRILAQTLTATLDLPPADNSAMDGYAIRIADYAPDTALPIQQRSYAGDTPEPLQPGNAIRLFTGSIMPEGADTVIMQEDTTERDGAVVINISPTKGRHVRARGEDVRANTELFAKGTLLGAAEIALLTSQGYNDIPVFPQLKVGILTTGDELIDPGQPRNPEQIYNSNGPMLAAMVSQMGAIPMHVVHAVDTQDAISAAFDTLLKDCDLVLTVGGVSVGDKDLVKPTIEKMGGTLDLWRVRMKPGRPVALAHARHTPIVCLPGNPVSAYVVFSLLVTALMRTMQGHARPLPPVHYGRLATTRTFGLAREEFLRVQTNYDDSGLPRLTPHPDQGSAIISSLSWADGLARIPADTTVGDGDVVAYYDLAHWL